MAPSLVHEKFLEWTRGLDTRESMISIFSHIRDIPYSLVVPTSSSTTPQEQLLMARKGSCGAKHYLLAEMFRNLNLPVVYATFPFLWNDPDLHYPPELRKLAATLPVAHHLACRVQIGCHWILVDATWDLPLAKAGFPVNGHWDGYSETKCAVKPLKSPVRTAFCRTATNEPCRGKDEAALKPLDGEKNHWNEEDRSRYYSEKVSLRSSDEAERTRLFSREFSSWLETVRMSA
ncbi:MAG: hypothetical protein WC593_14125 [Methanoregula sp.]